MADVSSMSDRKPRRFSRYSLRGLLVAVTAIGIWLGYTVSQVRTQREAVRQIQAAGGSIMYEYHEFAPRKWTTAQSPSGPEWLRRLAGPELFDRPSIISLHNPPDDRWAEAARKLTTIKYLLLSGQSITDAAIVQLGPLTKLWELQLTQTSVTDDALKAVGAFPKLKWMRIVSPTISDAGIAHLAQLRDLEELTLKCPQVTDQSLPVLAGFKKLGMLDIMRTQITEAAAAKLHQLLPNCTIQTDTQTLLPDPNR